MLLLKKEGWLPAGCVEVLLAFVVWVLAFALVGDHEA